MLRSPALESSRTAKWLLAILLAASVIVAAITSSTYDTGDSLNHYLFARYAFAHPRNFLDSWAKPLFTLLLSVPAQAGFVGAKLFQCAVAAGSAWCAFLVARALRLPAAALAVLFLYAAPDYFRIQFSGLTEPLFGLVLIGAVALAVYNRLGWSAFLISWLPFVRSEGFILLGIWAVYLLIRRQWRILPLLGVGYAVVSVVGGVVLNNLGWVFGTNPYDTISVYGHGPWGHFISNLHLLLGWPLLVLFLLGGVRMVRDCARPARWREPLFWAKLLLVYGSITVFVGAHTIFWALGLFNSFGLTRVLTVITPLAAVVALNGLAWLTEWIRSEPARIRIRIAVALIVFVFPITGLRTGLRWKRDFGPTPEQRVVTQAVSWINKTYGPENRPPVAYMHPLVGFQLGLDVFDPRICPPITLVPDSGATVSRLPSKALVVWDDWFAPVEAGVKRHRLQNSPLFRQRWEGALPRDPKHPERDSCRFIIYEQIK